MVQKQSFETLKNMNVASWVVCVCVHIEGWSSDRYARLFNVLHLMLCVCELVKINIHVSRRPSNLKTPDI